MLADALYGDSSPSKKPQDGLTLLIVGQDTSECVIDWNSEVVHFEYCTWCVHTIQHL